MISMPRTRPSLFHCALHPGRRVALALFFLAATAWVALSTPAAAQSSQTQSPEAQAPAEALPEELVNMSRIKLAWGPSFSPAADRFSFVSTMSGQAQLWMMDAEGGWPYQLTGHADGVMVAEWSPDGRHIAFTVPPGGGGNGQIHLMEAKVGALHHRITEGGEETNWIGAWSPDGRSLYFSSNRRDPEVMDIYRYEPATGTSELLLETEGLAGIQGVSPDGRYAALWISPQRTVDHFFVLDLESLQRFPVLPDAEPGSMDGGVFSADGRYLYVSTDRGRDLNVLGRVEVGKGGRLGPFEVVAARDGVPLNDFEISTDGSTGILIWNVGGRSELWVVDPRTMEPKLTPELPSERILDRSLAADGSRLTFVLTGAAAPLNLWTMELKTGELTQITDMPRPGVDLTSFVRPELTHYQSFDGLEISGWLYRPPGAAGPGPLAVSIHGGPEMQERPIFKSLYQGLLSRGISVFAPNVRGSAGFGKRFLELDNGDRRMDAIRDVEAAVNHLVKRGVAAPERLGVFGLSYGGFATLAAVTEYPDLFTVAASVSGIVNFETFFANTEPWIAAVSKVEYGDPDTEAELLRRISPIHRLDRVRVPMFVAHGANDDNVPVSEAEQVVESLRRRDVPVRYLRFENEGHAIRREENRIAYEAGIVSWFDRYLNAEIEAKPAVAGTAEASDTSASVVADEATER